MNITPRAPQAGTSGHLADGLNMQQECTNLQYAHLKLWVAHTGVSPLSKLPLYSWELTWQSSSSSTVQSPSVCVHIQLMDKSSPSYSCADDAGKWNTARQANKLLCVEARELLTSTQLPTNWGFIAVVLLLTINSLDQQLQFENNQVSAGVHQVK